MNRLQRKNQRGMALLMALFFVSLAAILVVGLGTRLFAQNRAVDRYVSFENCMYGIETGLAQSRAAIEAGRAGSLGMSPGTRLSAGVVPDFETSGVTPLALDGMPSVQFFTYDINWANDGVDNNGDGVIDGPEEEWFHTIYSVARDADMVRCVEAVLRGDDVNVWNNAIFAGAGSASGAIQGNCSIHGSVHILGNHIPEGGEAVVVLDMMGASLIHNNYGTGAGPGPALPAYLRARVAAPPRITVDGEANQETLNSVLRVKKGLISLNSASEIGEAQTVGNGMKDTMDAVYNTDGWTGQRTIDDGGRGDPTVVYSDNGWDELYDLGNKVPFPLLSDDWRWPARVECYELGYPWTGEPGGTELAPNGANYSHAAFFSEQLSDGAPYQGSVAINAGQPFYLNLTQPGSLPANRVKPDPANCVKGDDYLYYDPATNVLEINGQIEINGDLSFSAKSGGTKTIHYTGRAAILVNGNATLNTDLLSCNNGIPNDYANSFPERNFFGLMTSGNILMGEKAQLDLCGAFYAQGSVTSKKQTVVMGSFVTNFFNMGSQVPDIYQVPALAEWLPLGMVGNWPIFVFSEVSWREVTQ